MNGIRWIASYPKVGNTWLRCMLAAYVTGAAPRVWSDIDARSLTLEALLRCGELPSTEPTEPVLVKTHFRADVPVLDLYREATVKVLYLVRNPKDVLLSVMRRARISRDDVEGGRAFASDFIAAEGIRSTALSPGVGIGSWPENVRSWTESSGGRFPNAAVLVVRYEDLRADPVARFAEIVGFLDLGGSVDVEGVRRAVEACTLERMRELERRSDQQELEKRGDRQAGGGRPPVGGKTAAGTRTDRGEPQFVGEGKHDQSLSFLGADIEAAYEELVHGDTAFAHHAKQFGYAGQGRAMNQPRGERR